MARNAILQIRRNTEEGWASDNIILKSGEFGYEEDRNRLKIGDGTSSWDDLSYVSGGGFEVTSDPPDDPQIGDGWIDADTGSVYIFFNDEWVEIGVQGEAGPQGLIISDTPPEDTDVLWYDTTETGDAAVPLGGLTGQALIKASDSDYDLEWGSVNFDNSNNIIGNQVFS